MFKGTSTMTNNEIIAIAMQQSAIDSNCNADDFWSTENKIVISDKNANARQYLELPFLCDFTSYGNNIVASVSPEYAEIAKEYIAKFSTEHCFETPQIHWLINKLHKHNANVCFMAEYFLPNLDNFPKLSCNYQTRVLGKDKFESLYTQQWSNALCKNRKNLDVLGVGAYDNGELIGLAACSADCDNMWQIGVDVLDNYRNKGIGSCLTNQLAHEILKRNKVPFYCCAWANIKSVKNALKSGFIPSWVQMTVKPMDFINTMI